MDRWRTFGVIVSLITCVAAFNRNEKVGIFNVVKFPNDPCKSSDTKNGTCYTESECKDKLGTPSGTCAEGYGVCCIFSISCGQMTSENSTYFQSSGSEVGACNAKICPLPGVCQLRLDFSKFVISQPSKSTTTLAKLLNGVIGAAGKEVTDMGQCLTDSFSVTSPGKASPPIICGTNTDQHMYVEASPNCNILSFQLAGTMKPSWEIKVTQVSCNSEILAPSGCTQYYFGRTEATLQSYNFVGAIHLANQNQNVCIRREKNICRICYSTAAKAFDVSSMKADDMGLIGKESACCGYGADGMKTTGYDCVIIPGPTKKVGNNDLIGSEFCGRALASMLGADGGPATICSKVAPFNVRFLSDNFEFKDEAAKIPKGFEIAYKQFDTCV